MGYQCCLTMRMLSAVQYLPIAWWHGCLGACHLRPMDTANLPQGLAHTDVRHKGMGRQNSQIRQHRGWVASHSGVTKWPSEERRHGHRSGGGSTVTHQTATGWTSGMKGSANSSTGCLRPLARLRAAVAAHAALQHLAEAGPSGRQNLRLTPQFSTASAAALAGEALSGCITRTHHASVSGVA